METVVASIIVPAHSEALRLPACLGAFWPELREEGWELLVVDDGSQDDTALLAVSRGARVLRHAEARGVAAARNSGAAAARAPILVFVDADIQASADCLRLLVGRLMEDGEVHATGARPAPSSINRGYGARIVELRACLPFEGRTVDIPGFSSFQSECGAIRRDTFEHLGGFNERYSGVGMEEFHLGHELCRRGLENILLVGAHYAHHYKPMPARMRELVRRTARWVPLLVQRRRFESVGAVGTGSEATSALLSAVMLAACVASPLIPWALIVAGLAGAAQLILERRFLAMALRRHGLGMALTVFPALQALHAAVGFGFGLGLARVLLGAGRRIS